MKPVPIRSRRARGAAVPALLTAAALAVAAAGCATEVVVTVESTSLDAAASIAVRSTHNGLVAESVFPRDGADPEAGRARLGLVVQGATESRLDVCVSLLDATGTPFACACDGIDPLRTGRTNRMTIAVGDIPAPGAPSPIAPASGARVGLPDASGTAVVAMEWRPAGLACAAHRFELQVWHDATPVWADDMLADASGPIYLKTTSGGTPPAHRFFWHVREGNFGGWGAWSPTWSFVTGAGRDLDADGVDDLVVGIPGHDDAVGDDAGAIAVYFGVAPLAEIAGPRATGAAAGAGFGSAIAIGDFDGTGPPEVAVGSPLTSAGAGTVDVWSVGAARDLSMLWAIGAPASAAGFGAAVASGGDVNGDGFDDLVVGAPDSDVNMDDAGEVFLFLGPAGVEAGSYYLGVAGLPGERLGTSVAFVGDLNGDGFDDWAAGAPRNARIVVFLGGPTPDDVPDAVVAGLAPTALAGAAVAGAGDFNGDGFADLALGAPGEGKAYVLFGRPGLVPVGTDLADLTMLGLVLESPVPGGADGFGSAVASAGDLNRDGFADLVVGAPSASSGGADAGRVYWYFGGASADPTDEPSYSQFDAGEQLGWALAPAGDLDADGFADVVAGAPCAGCASLGPRVYVFRGAAQFAFDVSLMLEGIPSDDLFGAALR